MKEAEIKYIQVKGHQDEIQVLLLLRRYTLERDLYRRFSLSVVMD